MRKKVASVTGITISNLLLPLILLLLLLLLLLFPQKHKQRIKSSGCGALQSRPDNMLLSFSSQLEEEIVLVEESRSNMSSPSGELLLCIFVVMLLSS